MDEDDYYPSDYDDDDDYENYADSFEEEEDDQSTTVASDRLPDVKIINKEFLLAAQKEDLQTVMDLLSLREHHARMMLIHFRWDVHMVSTVLVESGADVLFSLAGIVLNNASPSVISDSLTVACQICFEEIASSEVTKMDCGHPFCKDCWTDYLIVQIQEGKSKRIKCMSHKCHAICDEEIVRDLVSLKDINIAKKFENILLESYVEDNDKVKWCPSAPHCGNAISFEPNGVCEVKCTCGFEFCFGCSAEAHSPCSCSMWRLWLKKCADDSETANWVTVNTKPCPKCFKPVNKDGGCNLVVCICGQPMCWLCGAPTGRDHTWTSISGHDCGSYKKADKELEDTKLAKKRLWRYNHYYNLYKGHTDSIKLESELSKKIARRKSKLEYLEYEIKDYSWLVDGLNRLFRARRILAYSYPFAFYMFGDELFSKEMTESEKKIKQDLFENQQKQFAGVVEMLSRALEDKIFETPTEEEVKQQRDDVLRLSSLTDALCSDMYSCIENDLLAPLSTGSLHQIAPYQSEGVKKASEFGVEVQRVV